MTRDNSCTSGMRSQAPLTNPPGARPPPGWRAAPGGVHERRPAPHITLARVSRVSQVVTSKRQKLLSFPDTITSKEASHHFHCVQPRPKVVGTTEFGRTTPTLFALRLARVATSRTPAPPRQGAHTAQLVHLHTMPGDRLPCLAQAAARAQSAKALFLSSTSTWCC